MREHVLPDGRQDRQPFQSLFRVLQGLKYGQIVGDISDEHDDPVETPWIDRQDGSVDLDARLSVEELEERFGHILTQEEREAEIETVGGLVFHLAEHVPARDEVLTHPSGLEFRVLEADARHILTLRMRLPKDWDHRHHQPSPQEDTPPALDA